MVLDLLVARVYKAYRVLLDLVGLVGHLGYLDILEVKASRASRVYKESPAHKYGYAKLVYTPQPQVKLLLRTQLLGHLRSTYQPPLQ